MKVRLTKDVWFKGLLVSSRGDVVTLLDTESGPDYGRWSRLADSNGHDIVDGKGHAIVIFDNEWEEIDE